MTLAAIRANIEARLDDAGTPSSYTDADILAAINEGLRLFALLTLCIERTSILKLQTDTTHYLMLALLSDWLLPLRVRCHVLTSPPPSALWDGPLWDDVLFDELSPNAEITMTPVRPVRLPDLAALNRTWTADRNATVKRYGCVGLDLLYVHPAPAETGTSLQVTYAAAPADLAHDADIPDIPEEDQQALVHYAVSTLPFNYGGRELQQGTADFERFLEIAQHRADVVRSRSRAAGYDRQPFELQAFDRSILAALGKAKKEKAAA
jgi:hypothetical protein